VKRIAGGFGVVLFALVAWMVYANVVSPDAEVIAKAEQLARDKLGCGRRPAPRAAGRPAAHPRR
jgi:hypothetical protein